MIDINRETYLLPKPDSTKLEGFNFMWSPDLGWEAEKLRDFLMREDVQTRIVEAILRTEGLSRTALRNDGLIPNLREFGFVGYQGVTDLDGEVKVSPLFEGDERSIAIGSLFDEFILTQSEGVENSHPLHPHLIARNFLFHTHPRGVVTQRAARLFDLISNRESSPMKLRNNGYLSKADLDSMLHIGREQDHSIVSAIGIHEGENSGSVMLFSLRDFDAYSRLDSQVVADQNAYRLPLRQKIAFSRAIGLNAFNLRVNLRRTPHLNPVWVEKASQALTFRNYPIQQDPPIDMWRILDNIEYPD